jgi:hypothetical protein
MCAASECPINKVIIVACPNQQILNVGSLIHAEGVEPQLRRLIIAQRFRARVLNGRHQQEAGDYRHAPEDGDGYLSHNWPPIKE